MPYKSIHDAISVRETSTGVFESLNNPERMGNAANIAYGGCTLGMACMVAHQGVPDSYRLYSLTGNFLGPALCDRKLIARIHEIRRTRTFVTRQVTVCQKQDDGSERSCLVAMADFHAIEKATLFTYSRPPTKDYAPPHEQIIMDDYRESLVRDGKLSPQLAAMHKASFGLSTPLWETRMCKGSLGSETLLGFAKHISTAQDQLPMHQKSSSDWFRSRAPLASRAQHAAALAYQMDAAISFIPLTHAHMSLADAGACSTLDFALRLLSNDFDLNQWHQREWKCIAAGVGRTYSESQLWDEHGTMVASMTQSCIMRPLPAKL